MPFANAHERNLIHPVVEATDDCDLLVDLEASIVLEEQSLRLDRGVLRKRFQRGFHASKLPK